MSSTSFHTTSSVKKMKSTVDAGKRRTGFVCKFGATHSLQQWVLVNDASSITSTSNSDKRYGILKSDEFLSLVKFDVWSCDSLVHLPDSKFILWQNRRSHQWLWGYPILKKCCCVDNDPYFRFWMTLLSLNRAKLLLLPVCNRHPPSWYVVEDDVAHCRPRLRVYAGLHLHESAPLANSSMKPAAAMHPNDLYYVGWGIKLYSLTNPKPEIHTEKQKSKSPCRKDATVQRKLRLIVNIYLIG